MENPYQHQRKPAWIDSTVTPILRSTGRVPAGDRGEKNGRDLPDWLGPESAAGFLEFAVMSGHCHYGCGSESCQ
jgi:hypothetical protein